MTHVHQLAGVAGSRTSEATYAAYYASIAQVEESGDGTVRHRLRPEAGDGTIEVTSLRSGFDIVRYDVAFAGGHRVGYSFPGDHFELEHCVDGRMSIRETHSGAGELRARSVALSPRCATEGVVAHGDGERYRAVSITGTWSGLTSRLGGFGVDALPDNRPESVAREQYLGGRSSGIGHEVGYASPSNFGYAFRRDRGITPAKFRRAHS
ncbi:hypothetical protein Stube_11010 [Streptomyces tubercidicus]|uniref:HTH araC/xylS-type domain-containing protein n=1 Tax=Streptomyces tubercidicus TaxID=47759 RepID=A0A640UK32_9ACTN|nr:hypothetical protein Stube_11010 [Streptomyces tubercidicus]